MTRIGKEFLIIAAALVAALTGLATTTAVAAPSTVQCGAPINSVVKTEIVATVSNATSFAQIPGAAVTVIVAPSSTRCIKVRFLPLANCDGSFANQCLIRVLDNSSGLSPVVSVNGVDGGQPLANAFEWVRRVGPGTHTISVQRRVTNTSSLFHFKSWMLDVEVTN